MISSAIFEFTYIRGILCIHIAYIFFFHIIVLYIILFFSTNILLIKLLAMIHTHIYNNITYFTIFIKSVISFIRILRFPYFIIYNFSEET